VIGVLCRFRDEAEQNTRRSSSTICFDIRSICAWVNMTCMALRDTASAMVYWVVRDCSCTVLMRAFV
jgi:hypothetical protein